MNKYIWNGGRGLLEIAVLFRSETKKLETETMQLPILDVKIAVFKIPFRKRIKRKHKKQLQCIYNDFSHILTSVPAFFPYKKGICEKNIMYFYPKSCIDVLTRSKSHVDIAFWIESPDNYAMEVLKEFGKTFPYITLYTDKTDKMSEFAESFFDTYGIPLRLKEYIPDSSLKERYIVIIGKKVMLYKTAEKTTVGDVMLSFMTPLKQYTHLPISEIWKTAEENGYKTDLIKMHKVKIVGEISK